MTVEISDHALIRYCERVKGIDMEAIRVEMKSEAMDVAHEFGAPVVIGSMGERHIIRNGVVVTVLAKGRSSGRGIRA